MKRLIVCCDGTWQRASQAVPTNVVKMARSILPKGPGPKGKSINQIVYYDPGVGAPFKLEGANAFQRMTSTVGSIVSGMFGSGMEDKICAAYHFLAFNYEEGDEIYLLGFSRGAYTARSLAGMIYCSGLLRRMSISKLETAFKLYRAADIKPSSPEAVAFREAYGRQVPIRFLGCWDTVGMRGMPTFGRFLPLHKLAEWFNRAYKFHDNNLNRMVEHARHACAIDEDREGFPLTPMLPSEHAKNGADQVKQAWFAGDHGGVGGGEAASERLADVALEWMANEAGEAGLACKLDSHCEDWFSPQPLHPVPKRKWSKIDVFGHKVRMDPGPTPETLHSSVLERYHTGSPRYRPKALRRFVSDMAQSAPSP